MIQCPAAMLFRNLCARGKIKFLYLQEADLKVKIG
jgi:hypothetical protein